MKMEIVPPTKLHAYIGSNRAGIFGILQRIKGYAHHYPETGIHPSMVKAMVWGLRKSSRRPGNRVVIHTCCPLVVNELQPTEVTIVTGTKDHPVLTRFSKIPRLAEALKVYALGEFWLSYCADDEVELLRGGAA